jgi:NADPH-dependent 2,4-dienoyl-CoA reductase/sulfur reductase-like enzyme
MHLLAVGGSDAGISAALRARELDRDLEATRLTLRLNTLATAIDVAGRQLAVRERNGAESWIEYDELVVGTGAQPVTPPIEGLTGPATLGPADGVHPLHTMEDTFALTQSLDRLASLGRPARAVIIGAGYVGLEMAEGLTARGLLVTQVETQPEVLPTVDPELGAIVHDELTRQQRRAGRGNTT